MTNNDVLQIGLIGIGAIGRTHIDRINNTLQGGRVIAVSDAFADAGKKVAAQFGCKFVATGEELINDTSIDAVVVTTADPYHAQYVKAAVQAGKYVFCEKPLAPAPEACKEIVDLEMAGGKQFVQVGFMRRYDWGYQQLKDYIANRTYGEPLMLHCAHRNPDVPEGYDTPMAVENSMIHEIDVLRWLLGEDYATAEVRFPKKTRHARENLQDPQIMYLTTKSGVRIDVEAFVCNGWGYDIKCEVCCEDAIISLPEPANAMIRTNASRIYPICKDWSTRFVQAYNTEFQEWINSCKAGCVTGPTAWDGYAGQVTAAAASKARDTQTVVNIDLPETPDFYKK
jgi:myo-inositol 2-dehydrogenase/D-chiro-inositol 1-dehydrogenase